MNFFWWKFQNHQDYLPLAVEVIIPDISISRQFRTYTSKWVGATRGPNLAKTLRFDPNPKQNL